VKHDIRVAYISFNYPNYVSGGGALSAYQITKELSKTTDLTVFAPDVNNVHLETQMKIHPVPINQFPYLSALSFILNIKDEVDVDDYDIIHCNEIGAQFLSRIDVLTIHHRPITIRGYINSVPISFAARKAKKIVVRSEESKNDLSSFIDPDRISIIKNGINREYLRQLDGEMTEEIRKQHDLKDSNVILNINTEFSKRKNFPLMIDTIEYLLTKKNNLKLLLIGRKEYEENATNAFEDRGIPESLIYVSDISSENMPYYYHVSDFLAMPSIREGFSLPLIESTAIGKPFVSFDVGIALELANKGFGVIAKNEGDFKQKCLEMLESPFEIYPMSREYVIENFSWRESAKETVEIYEDLLF